MGDLLKMCDRCGFRPAGDGDYCTECSIEIRNEKEEISEYVCTNCGTHFTSNAGETPHCPNYG